MLNTEGICPQIPVFDCEARSAASHSGLRLASRFPTANSTALLLSRTIISDRHPRLRKRSSSACCTRHFEDQSLKCQRYRNRGEGMRHYLGATRPTMRQRHHRAGDIRIRRIHSLAECHRNRGSGMQDALLLRYGTVWTTGGLGPLSADWPWPSRAGRLGRLNDRRYRARSSVHRQRIPASRRIVLRAARTGTTSPRLGHLTPHRETKLPQHGLAPTCRESVRWNRRIVLMLEFRD